MVGDSLQREEKIDDLDPPANGQAVCFLGRIVRGNLFLRGAFLLFLSLLYFVLYFVFHILSHLYFVFYIFYFIFHILCRMRGALLLLPLLGCASALPQGGFLSGIGNAFNNFFGGFVHFSFL